MNSTMTSTVTRTYRTAIRIGEDFITIEETITLPADASDADIARAVDAGRRIYAAQREAVAAQAAAIRGGASTAAPAQSAPPPERPQGARGAPASEKQRNYIAVLQDKAGWSSEDLAAYAAAQRIDLAGLTAAQASDLITHLKLAPPPPSALVGGVPPMLAALDDAPPPEPNGDDGVDIPF